MARPQNLNFLRFIASERFGAFDDHQFHLSLLPVPYAGDLANADIFVLLLNPGLSFTDYYGEWQVPEFRKRLKANLHQDFRGVEFPFFYLDPKFCWHSGFGWWERKLRDVATIIARTKYKNRYLDALRDLSRRIAAIELVPYHSRSFRDHRLLDQLPSASQARGHVSAKLLRRAAAGRIALVVTRQSAQWGLPRKGGRGLITYVGGQTRGASLSSRTKGGRAILARYGI